MHNITPDMAPSLLLITYKVRVDARIPQLYLIVAYQDDVFYA